MTESRKNELSEIFNNKFINNIKARIIETCTAYKGVDDAELFSDYINSLNKDETIHLWNFVKTLGWDTFTHCVNDGIESFKRTNR